MLRNALNILISKLHFLVLIEIKIQRNNLALPSLTLPLSNESAVKLAKLNNKSEYDHMVFPSLQQNIINTRIKLDEDIIIDLFVLMIKCR
jgi:hypothetical protein